MATQFIEQELVKLQTQRKSVQTNLDQIAEQEDRKAQYLACAEALDVSIEELQAKVDEEKKSNDAPGNPGSE